MMRKLIISAVIALCSNSVFAGGLMTNTNYHIAFDRMFARGASMEIDAAYSNPAGLAWGHEGFQLSLNFQKPWQHRDIETSIPNFLGSSFEKKYNGVASAPIVPALFASYKKDRWVLSTMIGIVGSGGFVKYDDGVPMFEVPIRAMLAQSKLMPGMYDYDAQMKGKQYIYGAQLNFTYRITDNFAAAVGLRANYYDGYNRGFVSATTQGVDLINLNLDCIQRGFGVAPIFSFDYHNGPLTVAARYEFRTKIETKNDTKELSGRIKNTDPNTAALMPYIEGDLALAQFGDRVAAYQDGVKTRYDMPSMSSPSSSAPLSNTISSTTSTLSWLATVRKNSTTAPTRSLQVWSTTSTISSPSAAVVSVPTTVLATATSRTPRLPATATASALAVLGTSPTRCASTSAISVRSIATTRSSRTSIRELLSLVPTPTAALTTSSV